MDFTSIDQTLHTLALDFSYVNRKYFSKDEKKTYTLEEATTKVFNEFTGGHPTEYTPFMTAKEALKDHIKDIIRECARAKKEKQTNSTIKRSLQGQESNGLSAKLENNPLWQPSETFNVIDAAWCKDLVLDDANILYKRRDDGSLVVVDQLNKAKLAECVNQVTKLQDIPEPVQYCRDRMAALTAITKKIEESKPDGYEGLQEIIKRDYGTLLNRDAVGQTLQQYLGIPDSELYEIKDADALISKLVYFVLDHELPASSMWGFSNISKIYNTYIGEDDAEHCTFDGFKVSTRGNQPFTRSKYFEKVLDEEQEHFEHIKHRPIPVSCRNDDGSIAEPAFGIFNEDLYEEDKKKYGGLKYEDSYIVKTFLDPMDADQKKWTLAWYYATFFSFKLGPVIISRLHQDGGGTLKSTVKNYIRYGMTRYFGTDVTFSMKRGELLVEQCLYDSKRKMSLADCLYCMYDEPTDRGPLWEAVKAKTGNPTVEMLIKQLYVNPFSAECSVVFDFGSNKPIYLSEKSAFERRLGIIRTSAQNTYKLIPTADFQELAQVKNGQLNDRQLREFHLLLSLGEKCYKEIIKTYGTLAEAATSMPSIAKELEDTAPWNEMYLKFYNGLFRNLPEEIGTDKPLKLASEALRERLAVFTLQQSRTSTIRLDENGLINFIKAVNCKNDTKKVYYDKVKLTVRGWHLYRPIEKPTDKYTEVVDDLSEYGLDENGNVIPSAPESVLMNGSKKANVIELNRRQFKESDEDLKQQMPDFMGQF